MLIPPKTLQQYWHVHPDVVIHIGAHEAEELADYQELGWGAKSTIWVEALPAKAALVEERTRDLDNNRVITMVAWDKTGDVIEFNEASNGASSSALPLGEHASIYPDVVVTHVEKRETTAIADAIDLKSLGRIGLVNLDIQGAELHALKGFGEHIAQVDAIYSEVNIRELYMGCALLTDLDEWLAAKGFTRVDWVVLPEAWGDALWLRQGQIPRGRHLRRAKRLMAERIRRYREK